jgi:hypothetical protein
MVAGTRGGYRGGGGLGGGGGDGEGGGGDGEGGGGDGEGGGGDGDGGGGEGFGEGGGGEGSAISRRAPNPSCGAITSLYSPLASLKNASDLPSGDHTGAISAAPLVFVMLRTSPFSAGIVKISPRASTAARLPVADSARLVMRDDTSFHDAIIHGKSPVAVMFTTRARPVLASSSCT